MPGSRLPGPWGTHEPHLSLADGTQALIRMPSGGPVGSPQHLVALEAGHQAAQAQQQSQIIDADGMFRSPRVTAKRSLTIEHGDLSAVLGIIVHQTGGASAVSALDSYKQAGANGAHFLIDKDGTIFQTASVHKQAHHVGKLRARCLVEHTCSAAEIIAYRHFDPSGMHKHELTKSVPDRYPGKAKASASNWSAALSQTRRTRQRSRFTKP